MRLIFWLLFRFGHAKRNMDKNNAIVKHSLDLNQNINIDNNSIIFKENDYNKRKIIESIIISKTNTFNINQQNYNIDKFSSNIAIDHNHRLK